MVMRSVTLQRQPKCEIQSLNLLKPSRTKSFRPVCISLDLVFQLRKYEDTCDKFCQIMKLALFCYWLLRMNRPAEFREFAGSARRKVWAGRPIKFLAMKKRAIIRWAWSISHVNVTKFNSIFFEYRQAPSSISFGTRHFDYVTYDWLDTWPGT